MAQLLNSIERISNDHHSGSGEILKMYIELFKKTLQSEDLKSDDDRKRLLIKVIKQQESHNAFFIVRHFLKEIEIFFQSEHSALSEDLSEFIREYESAWKNVNDRISANAISNLQLANKTILLHSNSSTIKDLFRIQKKYASRIKIIQTESRPVMEGRLQAGYLARLGYNVKLITDASIARYAENIDMSILGADAIFKDFFINKCGSYLIALLCKEKNIPLWVLADSRKLWINQPQSQVNVTFHEEVKSPSEIWKNPPSGILAENYYFESIPNELVDFFITETGAYPGKEIQNLK